MTFRDRMKIGVSRAELDILCELQRRGLMDYLETQKGFKFDYKADAVHGTTIDFFWQHPYNYAVFLDGVKISKGFPKLHLKKKQSKRDQLVTAALEKRKVEVRRFQYTPPLRKSRLKQICDEIEARLKDVK